MSLTLSSLIHKQLGHAPHSDTHICNFSPPKMIAMEMSIVWDCKTDGEGMERKNQIKCEVRECGHHRRRYLKMYVELVYSENSAKLEKCITTIKTEND